MHNLLLELSKFEIIDDEQSYNCFTIGESQAYYNHLDKLFREFFFSCKKKWMIYC